MVPFERVALVFEARDELVTAHRELLVHIIFFLNAVVAQMAYVVIDLAYIVWLTTYTEICFFVYKYL